MSVNPTWPVPITTVSPCAVATAVWKWRGQLHVTVIVKATFTLVQDGPMTITEPEGIVRAELHYRNNPARSVCATSDLMPYLRHADVLLTGHARAPKGQPVPMLTVRLCVQRTHVLLNKTLHVLGDLDSRGNPRPFEAIPIVYERAFGGIGFTVNPLGTGVGDGKPPNVVHPSDPNALAGFGPIASSWPERKKLLRGASLKAFKQSVPELPTDLDWAYFQAAPADQRIDFLKGNEWVVLEGLHDDLPRLSSRLPNARAVARVQGLVGSEAEPERARWLDMKADTLRIDADAQLCSLVWRASFPLRNEAHLSRLQVVAGVSTESQPLEMPGLTGLAGRTGDTRMEVEDGATLEDMIETVVVNDGQGHPALIDRREKTATDGDEEVDSEPLASFRPSMRPPVELPSEQASAPSAPDGSTRSKQK